MSQRLRLINEDETETLDLLSGALRVTNWDWQTTPAQLRQRMTQLPYGLQAASLGYPYSSEVFTLGTFGCDEDIRAAVKRLEQFLENAAGYMDDPIDGNPHWLEWMTDGESPKRALISGGQWQWVQRPPSAWQMLGTNQMLLKLVLTRAPCWENVAVSGDSESSLSTVGGTWAFNATAGRLPARLAHFAVLSANAEANAITTVWAGFRPEYHGLAAFNPVWECESSAGAGAGHSTLDADTADSGLVATYSNSYAAITTFVDTNLERRLYMRVWDVLGASATNAEHFAGRYLVLCRCFIDDDAKSAAIQMRWGLQGGEMTICDLITISHDAAQYVELGEIQIPAPGISGQQTGTPASSHDSMCAYSTVELWAQNVDAATLTMDCVVLMPADHFLKLDGTPTFTIGPGSSYEAVVLREADERLCSISRYVLPALYESTGSAASNGWYIPIGNSVLVIAGQRAAEQVVADTLGVWAYWHPRWMSYRE